MIKMMTDIYQYSEKSMDYSDIADSDYVMSEDESDEDIELECNVVSDSESDIIPYVSLLPLLSDDQTVTSTSESQMFTSSSQVTKRFKTTEASNEIITSTVNEDVEVQLSGNKEGIRIWDKIHYCVFCQKGLTNITKHYLGVHQKRKRGSMD